MGSKKGSFVGYIGIDYSGAKTPTSSLKGLRVYRAGSEFLPEEVNPPPGLKKYWTRRGVAEWIVEQLSTNGRALVGIDHGFSFPRDYFETHGLPHDWPSFLADFQHHWPTDGGRVRVDDIRKGELGSARTRSGNTRWRRLTERRAPAAKSVFHFDVPGAVAKSTHSGLPWLRYVNRRLGGLVHFWPFDGWQIPPDRSVIVEVYPALWNRGFAREDRTSDQHDAYSAAAWMQQADTNGTLSEFFNPSLTDAERTVANIEGWILGIK